MCSFMTCKSQGKYFLHFKLCFDLGILYNDSRTETKQMELWRYEAITQAYNKQYKAYKC